MSEAVLADAALYFNSSRKDFKELVKEVLLLASKKPVALV